MADDEKERTDQGENRAADRSNRKGGRLVTRRRVLIAGGSVLGAAALGAGGYFGRAYQLHYFRDAEEQISDHRVRLPVTAPRMVIARGTRPARNVRAVLEHMGTMRRFISPDDVVVIKPNIGWDRSPEQAANTHPEVVAEVVRACREVGPKRLIVCDCPVRNSERAFELSGIGKAALEAGAEVLPPERSRFLPVKLSDRLGTWDILEPFVLATKLINVPVAKHHSLTGVVAGMKNWIGITNKKRVMFHGDIQRSIAELAALMRPTLTVIDATLVLMARGPAGGNPNDVKPLNTVAAGIDPVALDAWAYALFDTPAGELPGSLFLAEKMGLGLSDFRSLEPVEIQTG